MSILRNHTIYDFQSVIFSFLILSSLYKYFNIFYYTSHGLHKIMHALPLSLYLPSFLLRQLFILKIMSHWSGPTRIKDLSNQCSRQNSLKRKAVLHTAPRSTFDRPSQCWSQRKIFALTLHYEMVSFSEKLLVLGQLPRCHQFESYKTYLSLYRLKI